jgi:hypothetical protein
MLRTTIRTGFALLLLACVGAAAVVSPAQLVQQRFVDEVTAGWQSFEVCEHHSRGASRDAFFTRALDLRPGSAGKVRESKELTVRESGAGPALHVGVAELEFPTAELAARVHGQPSASHQRFLAGTKILTRYVTSRQDRRLLVVYSETHLQPRVQRFLQQLEANPEQVWPQR